jgi:hypothetical protein
VFNEVSLVVLQMSQNVRQITSLFVWPEVFLTEEVSATAWKRTQAGKMKMGHFSGIKFAVGLAEETHNLLPSHEIRRKRTRRQNFSLNAQEENHPFSHCRY